MALKQAITGHNCLNTPLSARTGHIGINVLNVLLRQAVRPFVGATGSKERKPLVVGRHDASRDGRQ